MQILNKDKRAKYKYYKCENDKCVELDGKNIDESQVIFMKEEQRGKKKIVVKYKGKTFFLEFNDGKDLVDKLKNTNFYIYSTETNDKVQFLTGDYDKIYIVVEGKKKTKTLPTKKKQYTDSATGSPAAKSATGSQATKLGTSTAKSATGSQATKPETSTAKSATGSQATKPGTSTAKSVTGSQATKLGTSTYKFAPGIANIGNSCFYNSVIQLLYRAVELRDYLIDNVDSFDQPTSDVIKLLIYMKNSTNSLNSDFMKKKFEKTKCFFDWEGAQEDASEYLIKIVNVKLKNNASYWIETDVKSFIESNNIYSYCDTGLTKDSYDEQKLRKIKNECDTKNGYRPAASIIPENMISLPIEDANSVQESINLFMNPTIEHIIKSKNLILKEKTYHIEKIKLNPAKYLLLTLKRFNYNKYTKKITKINKFIELNDLLNINGKKYKLIGHVNHIGETLTGGHYVTYIKANNKWYVYDDISVNNLDGGSTQGTPYIILYEIESSNQTGGSIDYKQLYIQYKKMYNKEKNNILNQISFKS